MKTWSFAGMDSNRFVNSAPHWLAGLVLATCAGCVANPSTRPITARPENTISGAAQVHAGVAAVKAMPNPQSEQPIVFPGSQSVEVTHYLPTLQTNNTFLASASAFGLALTQDTTPSASVPSASIEQATAPDLDNQPVKDPQPQAEPESQTAGRSPANVEHFIAVALNNHPKILAARQKVSAAANVPVQVKALPDPMFSNTFWPIHEAALQTAGGRIGNQMNLTQQVPWPEKLGARAEIATQEIRIAQAELHSAEKEIVESVRLAYYELWYTSQSMKIIDDVGQLVDELQQVAEAKYSAGGSQQDVLRAQLEADRLDDQLITLRKQRAQSLADLATLLRQPVDTLPEPTTNLPDIDAIERLESYLGSAEQCNPELQGLVAEIQRDRSRERLACLQKYPDLTVGVQWGIISDAEAISPVADGNDNFNFTVGTTLPIWREKINGGIREAAHRRASTVQRYESQRDLLTGKIRRLVAQVDALVEQKKLYQDRILPRTRDTLELTITDYRGQRTDFLSVIEIYRELLMIELQLARLDASLASTLAQIDRAAGCTTY